MRPGPRTKAMSRVEPKTTARSYSGIWMVVMILDEDQHSSTKKLCILTSLPSHLSKHKEERQWGGDDDERVGEDVEDEGGGPPQPRVG